MYPPDPEPRAGHCAECGATLAHDQRYCIRCGARRGPLPAAVAGLIDELRAPGPIVVRRDPVPAAEADPEPTGWLPALPPLPAPSLVSLAVMSMLSFGVVAGSLTTPGGAESLAKTLVLALPTTSSPPPAPSGGSGGGSGGGGGGGGGGGSPAAAAQAPVTQQTITIQAPMTGGGTNPGTTGNNSLLNLPPIKHVFLIMLSGHGYSQSFGTPAADPYMAKTLPKTGELIDDYYGVAPSPLSNELALLSGQGPTQQTANDCPTFNPVTVTGKGPRGQVLGDGCVYPQATTTLGDELSYAGYSLKGYIQGVDGGPAGQPKSCRHPALGQSDPDQSPRAGDPYVTWRNPLVYFGSLNAQQCAQTDVGLGQLSKDLKHVSSTPSVSYIAPSPCDDGSDQPCAPGAPAGLAASDQFLKQIVPEIEASPAYKADGLIAITFDQAPTSGPNADTSSCCDQPTFPNLTAGSPPSSTSSSSSTTTNPSSSSTTTSSSSSTTSSSSSTTSSSSTPTSGTTTGTTTTGPTPTTTPSTTLTAPVTSLTSTAAPTSSTTTTQSTTTGATTGATTTTGSQSTSTPAGGGQVGILLLSQYVKPGSVDSFDTYNHFSLLKTIEDLFGVHHLGYSADPALPEFDSAIFNAGQS